MSKNRRNRPLSPSDPNLQMMKTISEGMQTSEDIRSLTSNQTKDQLKVFLVAQAKNELKRVLKLTLWLDKVEDDYMRKVEDAMSTDDLSLKQYESVISTIVGLLTRSNEIVSKILNDDSLMTILSTTIYTSDQNTTTIMSQLSDPRSREKVRNILSQVIIKADNYSSSVEEPDYIETNIESEEVIDE